MKTQKNKMNKTLRGLSWMLAIAGLAVTLLAVANWLPSLMQKGFARQFDTIEEAKRLLGIDDVLVPGYFPEGIMWPPSLILAQKKPYEAVVMEFKETEARDTALIVVQSAWHGSDVQLQRITLAEVKVETKYRLKGRNIFLQVGMCSNRMSCSRMTWREDNGFHYTVLLMSSPFELIKIVESMIR